MKCELQFKNVENANKNVKNKQMSFVNVYKPQ